MSLLGHPRLPLSTPKSWLLKLSHQDRFVHRLARVFREARESAGLSQNEVARRAGVARTGVLMLEQGTRVPTVLTAKLIAGGIGISLGELIQRAEKAGKD